MAAYCTSDGRPLLVVRVPYPQQSGASDSALPPVVLCPVSSTPPTGYAPWVVIEPYRPERRSHDVD